MLKISDICSKIYSGGTPTSTNPLYYDGDIPWLNTNEVNFCNIYKTKRTITELGLKNSAAKFVPINTIIVAMYGVTAGRCAIAKIPLTTNQACCNLVIDHKKADYRFVYYFLRQQSSHLNSLANGGAQQNLNSALIKKYHINLPNLATQNKIASILSAYDDLIEKNNRRMEILRGCAEELYKEWFVRFRFPNWQNTKFINGIPQGWEVKKAKDIFNITIGRTPSRAIFNYFTEDKQNNYSWISIADMRDKIFVSYTKEYLTQEAIKSCNMPLIAKNTVLLSFKLTVGQVAITTEQTSTNEAIAHFNTQNDTLREYTYLYLKNFNYDELGNTSAIGNAINSTIVKNMKFILPSKELLLKFKENVGNIFDTILLLQNQNELLKQQRDLLLPRLMSGKINVTP